MTDIDIWLIATEYNLPIILFAPTGLIIFKKIDVKNPWLLLSGDVKKDKYYFIRSPVSKEHSHQLILPASGLSDIGFINVINNAKNSTDKNQQKSLESFYQYLQNL